MIFTRSGVFRRIYLVCDSVPRFRDSTVKVTSHNRVDEASPEAVFFFESLLPHGLDIFVVGLEELIQCGVLGLSRPVEGERWVGL